MSKPPFETVFNAAIRYESLLFDKVSFEMRDNLNNFVFDFYNSDRYMDLMEHNQLIINSGLIPNS